MKGIARRRLKVHSLLEVETSCIGCTEAAEVRFTAQAALTLPTLKYIYILIDEREREGEREAPSCCSAYLWIHCFFLYVP